jgi:pheromone receptor transcription factor
MESLQACLNAPEPASGNENGVDDNTVESPEEPSNAHLPPQQSRPGIPPHMPQNYGMGGVGIDPAQAMAYTSYVQQQQRNGQYMPQQHAGHQS